MLKLLGKVSLGTNLGQERNNPDQGLEKAQYDGEVLPELHKPLRHHLQGELARIIFLSAICDDRSSFVCTSSNK